MLLFVCKVGGILKSKFINYSIKLIKKYHPEYNEEKIAELKYGLEGFYLTVAKLIVIFIIAIYLNILRETIFMLIFFNILRTTGFGLHATKSWICLLSSGLVFILFPILAKELIIPFWILIILSIIAIILIYLYAPADTIKRPLINAKKRQKYKLITTVKCIVMVIAMLLINDNTISNLILFGIYTEVFMILPISYKIFNLSYNNYKNYKLSNN